MAAIDKTQMLKAMIDSRKTMGERRPYIGFSGIGEECLAKLWYNFRWVSPPEEIDAKKQRIFDRGNLEEERVVTVLKSIGCEVFRRDEDGNKIEMTGKIVETQEEFSRFNGHVRGHPDGRVLGLPVDPETEYLLEIKTAKDSEWKLLVKHGLKKNNRTYYAQCQRNMEAANIEKTIFISVNKNDESWHIVFIDYDSSLVFELMEKEAAILTSKKALPKAYKMGFYKCDWCPHNLTCHLGVAPDVNCRTCKFSEIEEDGTWSCKKLRKTLSVADQIAACQKYIKLF